MEIYYIVTIITSFIVSYYLIFLAAKNALSSELKRTNQLLELLINKNDSINIPELKDEIKKINAPSMNITKYTTPDGIKLEIHTKLSNGYTNGDLVFIEGSPAPTGKYKINFFESLRVKDGRVNL